MNRYEGLIAAPHTPFDANGDLKLATVEAQLQVLLDGGVRAAFVAGTTGEAHSLTLDERCRLTEQWVTVAGKRLEVIVHVGHNCQRDAAALAAHAQQVGAAAVAALAPSYFRPASVDDLVDFLAGVAAAAPKLPFYYYDIPSMTGVQLPTDQLLTKAAARIPNLAGAKYTNGDLMTLQACLAAGGGRFEILFGADEILLSGLALGVKGAVGSTYNYAAPVYQRVLRAFAERDFDAARAAQRQTVELVRVLLRYGVMRAGKAIMAMIGADCGPVRTPLRRMSDQELVELYEALRHLDIFTQPLRAPQMA